MIFRDWFIWPPPVALQVIGCGIICYGCWGIALPAAVHDFIKPELGAFQLWIETGRWPFWSGALAMIIGMLLALGWAIRA